MPDLSEGRKPLAGRYVARGSSKGRTASVKGDTVEDYKTILVALEKKIEEICFDKATSSELKSDLTSYIPSKLFNADCQSRLVAINVICPQCHQ